MKKQSPHIEQGKAFFHRRQGQLNLACAQCHDDNWGKKLAGTPIPQAHPTGYPIYRLEWQGVGSLTRRFRNCLTGMRAELLAARRAGARRARALPDVARAGNEDGGAGGAPLARASR